VDLEDELEDYSSSSYDEPVRCGTHHSSEAYVEVVSLHRAVRGFTKWNTHNVTVLLGKAVLCSIPETELLTKKHA
jgi:hypothetical protein